MAIRNVDVTIAQARKGKKMSQIELARRCGIGDKRLKRIEKGEEEPGIDLLLCIAEVLECEVSKLYRRQRQGAVAKAGRFIDLTGRRFGHLKVIERSYPLHDRKGNGEAFWLCECDCGGQAIVRSDHLRDGHTQSCGCKAPEGFLNAGKNKAKI